MDFAQARIIEQGNSLHVVHGDDSKLYVEFRMEPVHQGAESEKQGRPIYKDTPYIEINFPGDRTKKIYRPVKMETDHQSPSDPVRFPRQWAAFMEQRTQVQEGTPIEQWGPLTRSQAMELKGMHIHTVEQLAGISDQNLTWLGARELRDKAEAWLKQASSGKEVLRLEAENAQLKEDLAMKSEQIRDLNERFEAMSARLDSAGMPPATSKKQRTQPE
ncbi:chromosome partitioning protein ParA [Trinickia sp. NRRL B-1857]|uniref:chromosome partitioning protein ParA n=1 Tax=Trinickia sp. NRRL B-1857 TaxID=3162879 RepID=UPI003D28BFD7